MTTSDDIQHIGFVGLGVMGRSMALNLIKAGFSLTAYTRTPASAKSVLDAGAKWAETPAEVASKSQVIITIVGFPADVREVYFGDTGILNGAPAGSLLIDMTTSQPSLAREIAEAAAAKNCQSLDAPVSGGDIGARNGSLSIMTGGDRAAFDRAQTIFQVLGQSIVYQGPAGSGQHTKMCNQITIASNMVGLMEALLYAVKSGLDPKTVLESIGSGAAASWSMSNLLPRVIEEDYEPGFFIRHFLKDIRIAIDESKAMGLELPGLILAEKLYEECVSLGLENDGTQALYKSYKRQL